MIREKWLIEIERSIEMGGTDAGFKFSIKLDASSPKKYFWCCQILLRKDFGAKGGMLKKLFKIRQMSKSPPETR